MKLRKTKNGLMLFALFLLFFGSADAQKPIPKKDSIIRGQTIKITQIYQPVVKQPDMPVLVPVLPPADTTRPTFQYTVPQQTLNYTYHSIPIRPLAIRRHIDSSRFQNYIKAGLGNLSSLYLDAGIGGLHGANYETEFHATHLNQKGKINNQQSSYTRFSALGKYFAKGQDFSVQLNLRNRRHRFYGYDDNLYHYGSSALQQSLTGGSITLQMKRSDDDNSRFDYQPELTLGLFGDNFSAHENRFSFNLPIEYRFGKVPEESHSFAPYGKISLGVYGNLVRFANANMQTGNDLIKINPAIDFVVEHVTLHAGISPTFARGGKIYFLPDVSAQAGLANHHLTLSAGWKSDVIQNTYLDLSLFNPFIDNTFDIFQTRSDQAFFGVKGSAGKFFSFGGTLSWRRWQNLPVFINDYMDNPDGKSFQVIFDGHVQAMNLKAFARFQPSDKVAVSAQTSWYNFYKTDLEKVWGYPTLQLEGLVDVHPFKKLWLHAGMTLMNGIYARQSNGTSVELPSIFDINAAGEYQIISRLSVFLQANNLLNKTYQRWNQYPVYGINVIGGVRFKF